MVLDRGAGITDERKSDQQNKRQTTTLMLEFILGEQRMSPPVGVTKLGFVVFAS
jgi:hypothetical protein